MKIGFDLDGIFVDKPPFIPKRIIELLYRKNNHQLSYRFPPKLEQIIRIISHYPFFRPPIKKNIEFIKKLTIDRKNKYYLISSRFGFLKKRTVSIVKQYDLDKVFDDMLFNFSDQQPHIFKDHAIKKLKIDRYIDDDLRLLEFVAKNNRDTKFFWLNQNQSKQLSKNIIAITNISEII